MPGVKVDIIGQKFGMLTVIAKTEKPLRWVAKCECGGIKQDIRTNTIRNGMVTSCGCLMNGPKVGDRFGSKVVTKVLSKEKFLCVCDCGFEKEYSLSPLRNKRVKGHCQKCRTELRTLDINEATAREMRRRYSHSADTRGYDFSLSTEEVASLIFGNCYYCGRPPKRLCTLRDGRTNDINGIDRKDNSIGYDVTNAVTCCTICNYAKHDYSMEEFMEWIDELVRYRLGQQTCAPSV